MNREMRRLAAREERLAKKNEDQRRSAQRQASQKDDERPSFFARLGKFFKEVRVELSRVSWPTREQMVAFTTVTLITTTALTLLVFVVDLGLREGVFRLLEVFR